jgi:hypothetical protein
VACCTPIDLRAHLTRCQSASLTHLRQTVRPHLREQPRLALLDILLSDRSDAHSRTSDPRAAPIIGSPRLQRPRVPARPYPLATNSTELRHGSNPNKIRISVAPTEPGRSSFMLRIDDPLIRSTGGQPRLGPPSPRASIVWTACR